MAKIIKKNDRIPKKATFACENCGTTYTAERKEFSIRKTYSVVSSKSGGFFSPYEVIEERVPVYSIKAECPECGWDNEIEVPTGEAKTKVGLLRLL